MDSDEDAVDCPVCYGLYDDPRNLPCGHSFCFKCISQVAGRSQTFRCPSCREGVKLDIKGVNGLPKNYTLGRIIERQEKMLSAQCSEHKKPLHMFCGQCDVMICFKCLVRLHSGHNIVETDHIFKIKKERLTKLLESTKPWQAQVQEKTVGVRLSRVSLQKNVEAINAKIDDSFERWTDSLEKQRKILRQYVNDKGEQMMKVFDDYLKVLDSANTEISNIQTEMNTTLSKGAIYVVQLFGSLERSHDEVGKKAIEMITTTFDPPKVLKIDISAPWMEEAIQNIKLFEPGQKKQENSFTRGISKILEENETLQRKLEESENEKVALKLRYKEKMEALTEEIRKLQERLKRTLEESEHEKVALVLNHKEEIGAHKEEIRKLKERLTVDKSSYEKREKELKTKWDELQARLKRTLEESENEIATLNVSHKTEIGAHKEEIRKLKERLEIDKSSYEKREKELKTKCNELEAEIASYKENWTKSEDAKIQMQIKITELEKKSKEGEREIKTWKNRYNSLEEEKRRTEEELKRLEAKTNQLTNQLDNERKAKEDALIRLEAKNNQLTNQLDNERKAKEDALLRLSSMASNKLRDNSPNTADLSDPNRPTKLSDQFSELYDNEWTDAWDELEKLLSDKKDKEIISYLRDFVLEIHSVCSDISSSKMKTIEEAFVKPSVPSENTKIPTEIFKTIKDGIKSMAPKLLEHTRERVLGHLEEKYFTDPVAGCLQHQNVKRYIDKCTEVCWYMSVQDPQLVMDGSKSPDEKFDSNKHREYTKKGPYEEFVVWPALYLYRGGQMLSKGVAQGGKKEIGQQ